MRRTDADPNFEEAEGTIGCELRELISRSWDAWDAASDAGVGVDGSMPILYFGDLLAYQNSILRVVTVGLNPSGAEFPSGDRYARFPGASGVRHGPVRYFEALNAYFETNPYRWFNNYEHALRGLGASYTPNAESTALHTDICSPVATVPTWSSLDDDTKDRLLGDGVPLWHDLIRFLRPQVIVMSVAKRLLSQVDFHAESTCDPIHTVTNNKDGAERIQPYVVTARWHDIGEQSALLVYGKPAQTPFGTITHNDKRIIGEVAKTYYDIS
ncbi:MAG: hypothetical protein OXH86_06925 [Acidimicrobiaceae bacterium]|nr:hypothetical protein [Acidimicrobiaceae bacterium]MDE0497067.1 hypothetical protein [Acidimicrobiaceae bacterium]